VAQPAKDKISHPCLYPKVYFTRPQRHAKNLVLKAKENLFKTGLYTVLTFLDASNIII